jgi:Transcription elongation factor, GreA/GreB, C-term
MEFDCSSALQMLYSTVDGSAIVYRSDRPEAQDESQVVVHVGMHVEVELLDDVGGAERLAFDIVPERAADFSAGFLGAGTPIAQAILGERAGTVVAYRLADVVAVRILSVEPSARAPQPGAAEAREAMLREAVDKSNLEDAVRLALTVDVKWGDYDPEGLEPNWGGPTEPPDG